MKYVYKFKDGRLYGKCGILLLDRLLRLCLAYSFPFGAKGSFVGIRPYYADSKYAVCSEYSLLV